MKVRALIIFVFLCMGIAAAAAWAEDSTTSDAEMAAVMTPQTTQVEGDTDATLGPAKYPLFYDYQSNDPTCGDYLKQQFKVQTGDEDDGIADSGMSLAPIYLKSKYSTNGYTGGEKADYVKLPGLEMKGFVIPDEYRKTAGILITWTVRVEGFQPAAYQPNDNFCAHGWSGTLYQSFPAGEVRTSLFVTSGCGTDYEKSEPYGPEACMTIPDGGKSSASNPGDPTHTGSYLITPADFDGLLPSTLDFEIRWKNETCQQIKSPANMRSMIVTLMPKAEQAGK
ncbi:MAG: hypothetical protein PHC33_00275 [Candidatus Omnitrophica bacterium]|nr:hypothetical protein [Candidatus Omnitrophota bacterium]